MRRIGWLIAVVGLVACGGGGTAGRGKERPLTADDAARLSQVLFKDYEAKGAKFSLVTPLGTGFTLQLDGEIDWANHVGHALVHFTGATAAVAAPKHPVEVVWNTVEVLERIPAVNDALTSAGRPGVTFVARPADVAGQQIDSAIEVVTKLASPQRDNPQLLQQHAASAFMRPDTLRNAAVSVYRYTERSRYWVATDDGRLMRAELDRANTIGTTVVDLLSLGSQTIAIPSKSVVVQRTDIAALYRSITGS